MKKNKYFYMYISLVFWLFSCNDNFLDRSPLDKLNDGYFWISENDLKVYVNNFYNQESLLPTYTGWTTPPWHQDGRNGSDTYVSLEYNRRMNGEATLPASGGGWSYGDWSILRNINYFLAHYRNAGIPEEKLNEFAGEALFFRSIFYFDKLRRFGDLPWISSLLTPDSEILFTERLPRNQVVDSIMVDLDHAVSYLPVRGKDGWTGRVTKETALALQARIAMYEGTWEKYHALKNTKFKVAGQDGSKFIQKAADVSGALIRLAEENGYPALDNVGVTNGYWLLFNQKDYSKSKEVLFWRKYDVEEKQFHYWLSYTSDGAGYGMSKSMVDSYLCKDGKPIAGNSNYQGDATLKDVVRNRDPRLSQTIQIDDEAHLIWDNPRVLFTKPVFEGANEDLCTTGYQLYKGHSADYAQNQDGKGTSACIYFRYAETLLIYAEAKAELGTIQQTDIDITVNALRKRVGMENGLLDIETIADDPNWEFPGLSPLLQEIRRERKVELVCEGFRVDDIFRWAAADVLIRGKKPLGAIRLQWENYPGASSSFISAVNGLPVNNDGYIDPYQKYSVLNNGYQFNLERDYLYPISTDQIVLNPQLGQNPGW